MKTPKTNDIQTSKPKNISENEASRRTINPEYTPERSHTSKSPSKIGKIELRMNTSNNESFRFEGYGQMTMLESIHQLNN